MRFHVRERIGEGAFGAVYRAELEEAGGGLRPVALKVLRPDAPGGTEALARLHDEARLLGLVRHRVLVAVHGLVRLPLGWTLVLEHVEGADLSALVASGPLPPTVVLEVVEELASALDAAWHARRWGRALRVLHRDLKPSNVRITPWGAVRLLDLGAAKAADPWRRAHTEAVAWGTPRYLAPERLQGVDRTEGDVFSLGLVLLDALAGEPEQAAARSAEACRAHAVAVVDALPGLGEAARDQLRGLVLACLASVPEARPTPGVLAARCRALRRGLEGPDLAQWAPARVAAARVGSPPVRDAWCGRVVHPGAGSTGRVLRPLAAVISGVAVTCWAAAGAVVALAAAPAPGPEGPAVAAPAVEGTLGASLVEVSPAVPVLQGTPPPRPAARPVRPSTEARLELVDGPAGAVLRGPDGLEGPPGAVAPGRHEVWAPFGGRLVQWATADVAAGERVSLRCQARRPACRR